MPTSRSICRRSVHCPTLSWGADIALSAAGAVLLVVLVLGLVRHRLRAPRLILALGTVLPAAMMLTGAAPWNRASSPGLALSALVATFALVLTATALGLARAARAPVALVGAAISVAVFTCDAALGGLMQPGSMLNSRPSNGGRWYGFGNVTFAAYAAAGLVLAGLVAHRLRTAGHERGALIAAAVIGIGVVVCDGWPSMGADFGGVLALTPGVLWLLLSISGLVLSWRRVVAIGVSTVLLVTLVAWLDWLRGPTARTHAGAFFQRLLDGDATDVVARKAVAAAESLMNPARHRRAYRRHRVVGSDLPSPTRPFGRRGRSPPARSRNAGDRSAGNGFERWRRHGLADLDRSIRTEHRLTLGRVALPSPHRSRAGDR